ncbi:MAG: SRPBCC family protein [Paracoccaceae bacterium]
MKLQTRKDIEAPVAFVYKVLSDFDGWERSAMRRGADVNRTDKLRQPGPGMTWIARFPYRGKERTITVRVDGMDRPGHMTLSAFSPVVDGRCKLDLLELAAKRTRLHVELDATPKTFAGRLYFQSLRLARGRIEGKLNKRIDGLALEIEERFRREGS